MNDGPRPKARKAAAQVSSRYARRDRSEALTELLRGVNVCLILDQFGEFITCPIQEGDGARRRTLPRRLLWICT
jgi:hypothetical protein